MMTFVHHESPILAQFWWNFSMPWSQLDLGSRSINPIFSGNMKPGFPHGFPLGSPHEMSGFPDQVDGPALGGAMQWTSALDDLKLAEVSPPVVDRSCFIDFIVISMECWRRINTLRTIMIYIYIYIQIYVYNHYLLISM